MEDIKHTYKQECPYCGNTDSNTMEFLGPYIPEKGFARQIGDPHVEELRYYYRCNSDNCKGKEFTASWGGDLSKIIEDKDAAQKIVRKSQCPFCNSRIELLSRGGTYPGGHTCDDEPQFFTYVCKNVFCVYGRLKVPKALHDEL